MYIVVGLGRHCLTQEVRSKTRLDTGNGSVLQRSWERHVVTRRHFTREVYIEQETTYLLSYFSLNICLIYAQIRVSE